MVKNSLEFTLQDCNRVMEHTCFLFLTRSTSVEGCCLRIEREARKIAECTSYTPCILLSLSSFSFSFIYSRSLSTGPQRISILLRFFEPLPLGILISGGLYASCSNAKNSVQDSTCLQVLRREETQSVASNRYPPCGSLLRAFPTWSRHLEDNPSFEDFCSAQE